MITSETNVKWISVSTNTLLGFQETLITTHNNECDIKCNLKCSNVDRVTLMPSPIEALAAACLYFTLKFYVP